MYKNGAIIAGRRATCKVAATWNQEEFILLLYRHQYIIYFIHFSTITLTDLTLICPLIPLPWTPYMEVYLLDTACSKTHIKDF